MANATRETKTVEKIETVEEKVVVLTLTEDEAITLKSLTLKVGGTGYTYYDHVSKIKMALEGAGIRSWTPRFSGSMSGLTMPASGDE